MKLIFCRKCQDLFRLYNQAWRKCVCGDSGGRYVDDQNAEISGAFAIPVGFHVDEFATAIKHQPFEGPGTTFTAFVIPSRCHTIRYIEKRKFS